MACLRILHGGRRTACCLSRLKRANVTRHGKLHEQQAEQHGKCRADAQPARQVHAIKGSTARGTKKRQPELELKNQLPPSHNRKVKCFSADTHSRATAMRRNVMLTAVVLKRTMPVGPCP